MKSSQVYPFFIEDSPRRVCEAASHQFHFLRQDDKDCMLSRQSLRFLQDGRVEREIVGVRANMMAEWQVRIY